MCALERAATKKRCVSISFLFVHWKKYLQKVLDGGLKVRIMHSPDVIESSGIAVRDGAAV